MSGKNVCINIRTWKNSRKTERERERERGVGLQKSLLFIYMYHACYILTWKIPRKRERDRWSSEKCRILIETLLCGGRGRKKESKRGPETQNETSSYTIF